jgi:hypothetical protein
MEIFDLLNSLITDAPLYIVNGFLLIVYATFGAFPAIVSFVAAGGVMLTADTEVQSLASGRALRPGRGEMRINGNTAQVLTGIALALWLVAQMGMGAPVPWIGAVMWLAGFVAVSVSPSQRFSMLNMVKVGIVTYALTVGISRIYMVYATQVTPDQWAALVGSAEAAASIIANTRGNTTTIITWALWLVVPLGYFSLLVQQVFMNPISLTAPMATAQSTLRSLRNRGGQ